MVACGTISRGCSEDGGNGKTGVAGGATSATGVVGNEVVSTDGGGVPGSVVADGGGNSGMDAGGGLVCVKSTGAGAIAGAGVADAAASSGTGGAGGGAPSACGAGTLSVAPERRVLGLPLAKAVGLPATRMAIICGRLIAVEGRTRLATAARVSPGLTGP